jgi:hypothetical protein
LDPFLVPGSILVRLRQRCKQQAVSKDEFKVPRLLIVHPAVFPPTTDNASGLAAPSATGKNLVFY